MGPGFGRVCPPIPTRLEVQLFSQKPDINNWFKETSPGFSSLTHNMPYDILYDAFQPFHNLDH